MTYLGIGPRAANANSLRPPLSAFVVAYNREAIIGTCLRALAFADEIVVIDKGSTDATRSIAATLADRVITAPWSPTVEDTRAFALSQCAHDWVLFLDDDECLNPDAIRFLDLELTAPRADVYMLPLRHYIMGVHDERAYYWPEYHTRLFHRGAVAFVDKVHDGLRILSNQVYRVPLASGACIHHLSHCDTAHFIDKANRYTSRPNRARNLQAGRGIARFARERIDHWVQRTDGCEPDSYPEAVAVLRAVYDVIDRLKGWEEEAGHDGPRRFAETCARLDAAYAEELAPLARPHGLLAEPAAASTAAIAGAHLGRFAAATETTPLAHAVEVLRETLTASRDAYEAARQRESDLRDRAAMLELQRGELEARLGDCARRHAAAAAEHAAHADRLEIALGRATARAEAAEHRVRMLEASTCWRATAPVRAALTRLGR